VNPLLLVGLLLLPSAKGADEENLSEKETSCPLISKFNPELEGLKEGQCFLFQWEEYGQTSIKRAELLIVPLCGDQSSAARLEQKGRAYIASLQSIPIEVSLTLKECRAKSTLDLRVIETSTTPLSPEPR
jgi:hypothetical protein